MAAMIGETLTSALNGSADEDDEAEVEVREMDINDVARVYNLGEQIFTADRWPTLHRTWDEFEVLSLYLSDTDTCLVAEFEGQIVGFALGTLIEKRRSAWTYGYLLWLGVDQDQAGPRRRTQTRQAPHRIVYPIRRPHDAGRHRSQQQARDQVL